MNQQSGTTPIVTDDELTDLHARLTRTRAHRGAAPVKGIAPERVASLVEAWRQFDWRAAEAEYDALGSAVTATADGRRLHYLHRRAQQATGIPIALLHGWPDTPWQFRHIIEPLVAAGHDVVAPTAAGFGWSEEPAGELSPSLVADDVHALMTSLGYQRYAVHGTDWGATVGSALAESRPEAVGTLHLLQPPFDRAFMVDRSTASEAEVAYLEHLDKWSESAAYVSAHTHQADTLAAALDDSPTGLVAWIAEKYDAWSGDGIRDEDVLRCVATMWFTRSFRSSVRLYSEPASAWGDWGDAGQDWGTDESPAEAEWSGEDAASGADWGEDVAWGSGRIDVPTAFAIFPDDIGQPPREFAERFFAVERFTVMPRGGHWAALEEPGLVVTDLLEFLSGRE